MRTRFLAAISLCLITMSATFCSAGSASGSAASAGGTARTSQAGAASARGQAAQAVLAARYGPEVNAGIHPGNWAGWVDPDSTYSSAEATWTVPTVSSSTSAASGSFTWVGVDGWANSRLLRTGTEQGWDAKSRTSYYRAFWGTGPRNVSVVFSVSPGDSIYASLKRTAKNQWAVYLVDLSSGKKIVKTVKYTGPRQSAEFIHSAPAGGVLASTSPVLFYNARVNGVIAFSPTSRAVEILAGNTVASPSDFNQANNAFTVTDGVNRRAPLDHVFQRHSDGSIWVSTGDGCQSPTLCSGWRELDDNAATTSISAGDGTVFQLRRDGSIWEWTGGDCESTCRDWVQLDDNPVTEAISAGDGTVFQLHRDGSIWQSTGQACTSGTSCPGWTELDDNPVTVAISAGIGQVFQLHRDGSLWQSTGQPCTSVASCPGWQEMDDNPATVAMSAGAYLYQLHGDGSIWRSTGVGCVRASLCLGWNEFDDNLGTVAIAAALLTVYQLHKDGSIWQSNGIACASSTSCPGWTQLDDNQATVQISVSNGSLPAGFFLGTARR